MPPLRKRQDWGLWLMILKKCRTAHGMKDPLAIYRQRTDSISSKQIFKNTSEIKECQVIQKVFGEIILRIVKRNSYSVVTEKKLLINISQWLSPTIKVKFEYVDEISRTKAGEFKAVVSERIEEIITLIYE